MTPSKLKRLLSVKRGRNAKRKNKIQSFIVIVLALNAGYVALLVYLMIYYNNLVSSPPEPGLPVAEPFGKRDRILGPN